jgi:calreticulin
MMDEAFTNEGKDLVLQYTVKHEQKIDCGGAYIKLAAKADQASFGGDTPYQVNTKTLSISFLLKLCI